MKTIEIIWQSRKYELSIFNDRIVIKSPLLNGYNKYSPVTFTVKKLKRELTHKPDLLQWMKVVRDQCSSINTEFEGILEYHYQEYLKETNSVDIIMEKMGYGEV